MPFDYVAAFPIPIVRIVLVMIEAGQRKLVRCYPKIE